MLDFIFHVFLFFLLFDVLADIFGPYFIRQMFRSEDHSLNDSQVEIIDSWHD